MNKRWTFPLLLVLISTLQFFISNHCLKGYLRDEVYLAKELKTPVDSIDEYRLAEEPPFKYRLLFPAVVKTTHKLMSGDGLSEGFFEAYLFWSVVFYVASVLALYALLQVSGFSERLAFLGAIIFLFLPAMIMAFTLPVHTREDTLAYTLFFLGLIAVLRAKPWMFLAVGMAGVLTRETLLLLPLLYLFFSRDQNIKRRLIISFIPPVVWLSTRLILGREPYDLWEGLRWNIANIEQVIGFLFITFNMLWLPYIVHLSFYKRHIDYTPSDLRFFYQSSVFVLVLIVGTAFFGGIMNEVRLLNLFSPWVIAIFLNLIRHYQSLIVQTLRSRQFLVYAAISMLACLGLLWLMMRYRTALIVPGRYAVPYEQWIMFGIAYIFIFLLSLPPSVRIFITKNASKRKA